MKKNLKFQTEEQKEITRFVIVLVGLIVIVIGIYFFTRAFVTKDLFDNNEGTDYTPGVIDNTAAIVGNMLSRPENEYYVAIFDFENYEISYYNSIISKYVNSKDALKFYYVDLGNELNSKYIATDEDVVSKNFKNLESLKLGDITIIKIKKGKVTKFLTTEEDIRKELIVKD